MHGRLYLQFKHKSLTFLAGEYKSELATV